MTNKSPAFQFYPDDWNNDAKVIAMSPEEEGHYIRLTGICWKEGSLPSDPEEVQSLLKSRCETLEKVLKCFYKNPKNDSQLLHKRLEKERKKQRAFRKKKSTAGKKGASKRWKQKQLQENNDNGTAIVLPLAKNNSLVSVSNSVSNSKSKDKTKSDSLSENETWNLIKQEAFEKRWKSYPGKRDGKKASIGHWNASIQKYEDIQKYDSAMENYQKDVRDERNNGFPNLNFKNAKTFFNNWKDWIPAALEPEIEDVENKEVIESTRVLGNPVLEKFWNDAKEKIRVQVDADTFQTWFEPIYPQDLSNGILIIAVPNQYTRKCLLENYRDLIQSSLSEIRGSPILADFKIERGHV
jgi:uncharacterized protein YdaU (DUF1376 family)